MKNTMTILAMLFSSVCAFAQTDSVPESINPFTILPLNAPLPTFPTIEIDGDTLPAQIAVASVAAGGSPPPPTDFKDKVVVMPSPDMVGLINQVNAGVDLFTGKATANLPIYTLKSYDIEVPISLGHASNGVKVDEIGSSVGLSWTLNAGGSITRIMKNSPDESVRFASAYVPSDANVLPTPPRKGIWVFGYLSLKKRIDDGLPNGFDINKFSTLPERTRMKIIDYSNWFPVTLFKNFYDDGLKNIGLDTEPDEFYFKFGSYSGKFVFNPDGQILSIPEYKFKIVPTIKQIDGEEKIVAFKVTTTEGYVYYFGDENLQTVEKTMRKFYQGGKSYTFFSNGTKEKQNGIDYYVYKSTPTAVTGRTGVGVNDPVPPYDPVNPSGIDPFTSAWHLNRIESPTGDVVKLAYDNVDIQYVENRSYSGSVPNFKASNTGLDYVLSRVEPLKKIDVLGFSYDIYPTYSQRTHAVSIIYVNSKKLRTITTQDNKELVFKANSDRVDIVGGKKLDEITLYLQKNLVLLDPSSYYAKRWRFNYLDKIHSATDVGYPSGYLSHENTTIQAFINYSWSYINNAAGAENKPTFIANQFKIYKSEFNRTLLKSIDEVGYVNANLINTQTLYKLEYFNEENMMAKRFSNQQDKYGYYNTLQPGSGTGLVMSMYKDPTDVTAGGGFGFFNTTTLLSKTLNFWGSEISTVRLNDAKFYALKKITNNLGGSNEYSYNVYGDLKVQALTTATNGKASTRFFDYQGTSTPNTFPKMYQFNLLAENSVPHEGVVVYSSKPYELNLVHGSLFVSSAVKVTEGANGTTATWFRRESHTPPRVKKIGSTADVNICATCPAYPFPPYDDVEWKEGAAYQSEARNAVGKLVKRSTSSQSYLWGTNTSTSLSGAPTTQGLKGIRQSIKDKFGNTAKNEHTYGLFSYVSAAAVSPESEEIDYFEKSNDPSSLTSVSKKKNVTYSTVNNRVKTENVTNSDNRTYTQTYKYAFDYPQTSPAKGQPCNAFSHSYKNLVDKYMIGIPLETLSSVNGTTVNGSKVIYDCYNKPKYFYKYGSNQAECTSVENVTPNWFLQSQIAEYETFGRPKTIKYACNPNLVTLEWENDRILSKKYINRISTYQYDYRTKLLTKFTDIDGLVSEFQYDEFFRLKHSTGRNGNVINDYTYQTIGSRGTENAVQTTTNYFGNNDQTLQNKKTLDGFGRTLSATQIGFTPTGADISATVEYDAYGRPFSEIDPTKGTTPKTTLYESSPLSRVLSVKPHGSEKSITYKYGANEEALTIVHNGTAAVYPIGSLYVNTVLDEDGKPSVSYTDKLGRTVMTRRKITETTFADTKYLYNERGQVIKTLPPDGGDPFLYEYNTDGSLRRKTIPGFKNQLDGSLSWINYKYDARGRLNYTKDPNGNVTDITYTDYDEPLQTKVNNVVVKNIVYGTSGVEIGKPKSVSTMALETQTGLIASGRTAATSLEYDEYGRINSTINNGITGLTRTNQNWTEYWNTSDLMYYNYNYRLNDANTNDYTQTYKINDYDHAGRVIWTYDLGHASNAQNNNYYWLGAYTNHSYKENGWLQNKSVVDYGTWRNIQKIDYDYNNRGWLTAINDFGGSNKGSANVDFNCTALGQSNCVQVTRNFSATVDFNKNPCRTRFCTIKDMKISYSLDDEDKAGVVKKRDGLIYLPISLSTISSYYSNTASTTATVTIRRDNIEASLDAMVDKIFNLLVAQRIDQLDALTYVTQFRAQLKIELLQQFCPPSDRLFAEKIHYEDRHRQLNGTTYTPQYNGNISWIEWQVGDRRRQGYGYTYDALDRLTNARYAELTRGGFLDFGSLNPNLAQYNESITYNDARGNIKNLTRYGLVETPNPNVDCIKYGKIDELSYIYDATSNRLKTVTDAATGTAATSKGVVNGGGGFEYDFNGNMVEDKSKRLTIKYNFLNLPYEFTFASATGATVGRIFITYDADGNKLRKEVFTGTSTTPTSRHDYDNGVEYENNVLEFINLGSCRVVKDNVAANTYRAEHFLTDHLGNTRVVYSDLNRDGRIDENTEIVQENQYYPMGMQMEGTWNNKKVLGSPKQNYKFNESEWTEDFGLNWGDHGARYYLPAIGAWNGIDALAEKYASFSPFHFAMGNPISFSDPTGMGAEGWILGSSGHFWDDNINSQWEFNSSKYVNQTGYSYLGQELILQYAYQGKKDNYLLEDCGKEQRLGQLLPEFTAKESKNAPSVREDNPAYLPYNPEIVGVQVTASLDLITSSYSLSLSGALRGGEAGLFLTGGAGTGTFKLPTSVPKPSISISFFAADRTDTKVQPSLEGLKEHGVSSSATYGIFTGGYFQSSSAGSLLPQPGYKGINFGLSTPGYGVKTERTYTIGHIWNRH